MLQLLNAIFILLFSAAIATSATISSVSGPIFNGQSITVSGSDFGTNGPSVLLFDDFENGTDGNNISTGVSPNIGTWDNIQTASNTEYSSSDKISGNLAARFDSYNYPPNQHPNIYVDAPIEIG